MPGGLRVWEVPALYLIHRQFGAPNRSQSYDLEQMVTTRSPAATGPNTSPILRVKLHVDTSTPRQSYGTVSVWHGEWKEISRQVGTDWVQDAPSAYGDVEQIEAWVTQIARDLLVRGVRITRALHHGEEI